ncbi:unnamed protein product [Polarella glacialis]|uniref:RING-type domain-containing protein n=1 Tax=Polarella glacialis TaxID=89957 RepID=A0A813HD24_POLGL|nr:unnamed protein product [Polarella glacialis]
MLQRQSWSLSFQGMARAGLLVAELVSQTTLSVWSQKLGQLGREEMCSICQQPFELGEIVRVVTAQTTPCFHNFHAICLEQWLGKRTHCPACRTELRLPAHEEEEEESELEDVSMVLHDGDASSELSDEEGEEDDEGMRIQAVDARVSSWYQKLLVVAHRPASDLPAVNRELLLFVKSDSSTGSSLGRVVVLRMNTTDTVAALCLQIRQHLSLHHRLGGRDIIRFRGQALAHLDCSLAFYNVQNEATLYHAWHL